jgi:hypothetical protein
VDKRKNTCLNTIRSVEYVSTNAVANVQLIFNQSSDQSQSCSIQGLIPVVDSNNNPLTYSLQLFVQNTVVEDYFLLTNLAWRMELLEKNCASYVISNQFQK